MLSFEIIPQNDVSIRGSCCLSTCWEYTHELLHRVKRFGVQGEILEHVNYVLEVGSEGSVVKGKIPIPTCTALVVIPEIEITVMARHDLDEDILHS